jgi:transcriptional regulator with XRE-family HTH domain
MCPDEPGQDAGERLKALREAAGLTQPEAARRLGVDASWISRKERGATETTRVDLLAAEAAFRSEPVGLDTMPRPDERANLRRTVGYWVGRQEASVELMQDAAAIQSQVAAMQSRAADMMAKAIAEQRELMAHTLPTPREPTGGGTDDRGGAFLREMEAGRAALDAREAEQAAAKKRGRKGA